MKHYKLTDGDDFVGFLTLKEQHVAYAAQKKLLEYLLKQAKENIIWAVPTHIGVKGLPPEYLVSLLKEFGIGE